MVMVQGGYRVSGRPTRLIRSPVAPFALAAIVGLVGCGAQHQVAGQGKAAASPAAAPVSSTVTR